MLYILLVIMVLIVMIFVRFDIDIICFVNCMLYVLMMDSVIVE